MERSSVVNYDGPDESVECSYPGCTNRLRRSDYAGTQFCSREHRDGYATATIVDTLRDASRRMTGWTYRGSADPDPSVLMVEAAAEIERLREQVNSGRTGRERLEGLPEGTLPRV